MAQSLLPAGESASIQSGTDGFWLPGMYTQTIMRGLPDGRNLQGLPGRTLQSCSLSKRERPALKQGIFITWTLNTENTTFIKQRKGNDIWKGLYEFPLIETLPRPDTGSDQDGRFSKNSGCHPVHLLIYTDPNHIVSPTYTLFSTGSVHKHPDRSCKRNIWKLNETMCPGTQFPD